MSTPSRISVMAKTISKFTYLTCQSIFLYRSDNSQWSTMTLRGKSVGRASAQLQQTLTPAPQRGASLNSGPAAATTSAFKGTVVSASQQQLAPPVSTLGGCDGAIGRKPGNPQYAISHQRLHPEIFCGMWFGGLKIGHRHGQPVCRWRHYCAIVSLCVAWLIMVHSVAPPHES